MPENISDENEFELCVQNKNMVPAWVSFQNFQWSPFFFLGGGGVGGQKHGGEQGVWSTKSPVILPRKSMQFACVAERIPLVDSLFL